MRCLCLRTRLLIDGASRDSQGAGAWPLRVTNAADGCSNRQPNPRAEPEQWDQRVDEQARKRLGMSGEEFERRLNAGEIDIDDSPAITRIAMMLLSTAQSSSLGERPERVPMQCVGCGFASRAP